MLAYLQRNGQRGLPVVGGPCCGEIRTRVGVVISAFGATSRRVAAAVCVVVGDVGDECRCDGYQR